MRIYLDDDSAWPLLAQLLGKAGHDVEVPSAVAEKRVCLTRNYDDFLALHHLVLAVQGRHLGILVVRQDNDPTRDLTPKGIVAAIRKLESSGVPIANEYIVLNHWR